MNAFNEKQSERVPVSLCTWQHVGHGLQAQLKLAETVIVTHLLNKLCSQRLQPRAAQFQLSSEHGGIKSEIHAQQTLGQVLKLTTQTELKPSEHKHKRMEA